MVIKNTVAFAVPGDLSAPTGGYHYDRQLMVALRAEGPDVTHLALPGGFPFPDQAAMAEAAAQLSTVPAEQILIVDGLAFGAMETAAVDQIQAHVVALVHHPLAHESGLPVQEARRLRALERANLARAAHVLVPSPHIAAVLQADYAVETQRITVIRPGRPESRPLKQATAPQAPPLILSVGLLHPRKGHDILVRALAQLGDVPWRAVIVGSPWEPGWDIALAGQIETAGLSGRVQLAGRVEQDTLDALYHQAQIFALATRYEGYGMVFDEALVHGLPIVSTTAGAVPGTVPEDVGILVPPGDADAFGAALRVLLEDQTTCAAKAQAALLAGCALPSWADAAKEVASVLARVANRRQHDE